MEQHATYHSNSEITARIRRMQAFNRVLKALALAGDDEAERLVRDNTPEGDKARHRFIRQTMAGEVSLHPELSERIVTAIVIERLEK